MQGHGHDSLYVILLLSCCLSQLWTILELEKVKELKLEELWLKGNPLRKIFPDHAAYVRSVVVPVNCLWTFICQGLKLALSGTCRRM